MHVARALRWALLVSLVILTTGFVAPAGLLPGWTGTPATSNVPLGLGVAMLVHRSITHPAERRWVLPICAGILCFAVGMDFYLVSPADDYSGAGPVMTQVAYLVVYPLLLSGVLLALGQHLPRARMIVGLDGLTGALAGAAITASAVAPLVARIWDGSPGTVWGLAFVFGDLLLVAASLGALAIVGLTQGRKFAVWALGMLVFTVGDIILSYLLAFGRYQAGTWLDTLWMIGLGLIAVGATMRGGTLEAYVPPARSLAVVTLASLAAVTVLTIAPDWTANPLPTLLALATLALCGIRFALGFLQLRELAVVRAQALTDDLTGLANRRALYARLDELLGSHEEGPADGRPDQFALVLVDLDRFKEVNDSLGHSSGDDLLQLVVARFAEALKALDTPHLLSRLGGDEFAVVLDELTTPADAVAVGKALQASLVVPIPLGRAVLHVRASIGVAVAPQHGATRSDILFAADAAMYAAKTSGEPVRLYAPDGVGDRRTRLSVAEQLHTAVEKRELTVAYQPICATDGRVLAAEALVRWDHPTRGRLSPDEFIETAERYRLTHVIAERVLDVALCDLARWRLRDPSFTTSVNISASDLGDESIVNLVATALLAHRVPPEALTVEITETAMMRDPETAQRVMHALSDLGVELSVDDYGTGYSSLEYLLKLPVSEIKLDRAFSTKLERGLRSMEIVRSTVLLTHALGLRMVAEGVENESTLLALRELGCDRVQGWHLGRPMTATTFGALVGQLPAPRPAPAL